MFKVICYIFSLMMLLCCSDMSYAGICCGKMIDEEVDKERKNEKKTLLPKKTPPKKKKKDKKKKPNINPNNLTINLKEEDKEIRLPTENNKKEEIIINKNNDCVKYGTLIIDIPKNYQKMQDKHNNQMLVFPKLCQIYLFPSLEGNKNQGNRSPTPILSGF